MMDRLHRRGVPAPGRVLDRARHAARLRLRRGVRVRSRRRPRRSRQGCGQRRPTVGFAHGPTPPRVGEHARLVAHQARPRIPVPRRGRRALETIDIDRCKQLVIPPAWTEVWICPVENGHLQAVGTDDAGRRQYLYHPDWRTRRDPEKFEHMEDFAAALIRHRAARRDLGDELDLTTRRRHGLQPARPRHVPHRLGPLRRGERQLRTDHDGEAARHPHGRGLTFAYAAKSGQEVEVTVRDDRVGEVLDTLLRRRGGGDRLLAYKAGDGGMTSTPTTSTRTSRSCSARTSRPRTSAPGGAPSSRHRAGRSDASSTTARKRSVAAAMREVGDHLGNTPAVARARTSTRGSSTCSTTASPWPAATARSRPARR